MTTNYMEPKELLQWAWDKIRPKALYCDILDEDKKAYNTIKKILEAEAHDNIKS